MNLGKGLVFSAVGALAGAVAWIILIRITGWSLWVLAPIVGGAAGFGMMRAMQMRGGLPAGAIAAALTLAAIFGARYFVVSQAVDEHLAISDADAFAILVDEVAADMQQRGIEVYDEEGEYTPRVHHIAGENWNSWTPEQRQHFVASRRDESAAAASVLTPLGLLFDFGIFGTICAVLAAGTAFKTGSITLERALVDKGLATSESDAAGLASQMRAEDAANRQAPRPQRPQPEPAAPRASSGGLWSIPMQAADERPIKPIRIVSSEEPPRPGPSEQAA